MFNKWDTIRERLCDVYTEIDDWADSVEIAIIFDIKCSCVSMFMGRPNDKEKKGSRLISITSMGLYRNMLGQKQDGNILNPNGQFNPD